MAPAPKGNAPKGGKGKGRAPVDPIAQQAQFQVSAAEQPILQQIAQERAANLAKAQAQMGFSKAAASIMQAAAPAVSDLYSGAANADAGYARGLGNVAQQPVDQSVAQNNAFLQKMGTPTTGLETAAPIGDIAYGLHGYIPATTLQREGAAFGAAAQLAPGNELAAGQQLAGATLANDPNLVKLQGDLGTVAATEPKVYNDLLKQAQDQAYKYASLNSTNAYHKAEIGLRQQELQAQIAYHQASIGMQQARLKLASTKQAQALQLAIAKGAEPNSALSGKYGYIVDSHGNAILDKRGRKIKVVKSSSSSSAGLPPWAGGGGANPSGAGAGMYTGLGQGIDKAISTIPNATHRAAARVILQQANEYLGTPYLWGGTTPKGFDCSGFAQFLYAKAGISIPRTTYTQWGAGTPVGKSQLEPGDLVFFKGSDSIGGLPGHVGVYIGGGKMIDAPHTGASVEVDNINTFGGYMGARRYH